MSAENKGVLTPALLWAGLRYVLRGGLAKPGGHLPSTGHTVPAGFAGVGVATADDTAVDEVVMHALQRMGLHQARIDLSYGDLEGPPSRLLERLLAADIGVMLHLVQPFSAARRMAEASVQQEWHDFVASVLQRYGQRIRCIEIGSTINRRRWAGYDSKGFFIAWDIAYRLIHAHGITLAGPNVTDFEPLYNIAVLGKLAQLGQLPDIHTNNLFSERVTEPERYDHRILGFQWARRLKVNLVKKARLLQDIGLHFGVSRLSSPAAFWTLPRIERLLPDGEEKQADYLARHMLLCAASGVLEQAFWGPLICQREGLIDDGSDRYPLLERITHYASVPGTQFRARPALLAMRTFNTLIPGSRYESAMHTTRGLELHAFRSAQQYVHAVWTSNGKAIALASLYPAAALSQARCLDRDGELLAALPALVSEAPIYLCWPADTNNQAVSKLPSSPFFSIHRHMRGRHYHLFEADGWRGMFVASSAAAAGILQEVLHPARLPVPTKATTLRNARNVIWTIENPLIGKVVAKQPIKIALQKHLVDRFKPSKARRSWDAAAELMRRGIPTAEPIAYFERINDRSLKENYYICDFFPADFSARELLSAFAAGAAEFEGISQEAAYQQLSQFLLMLHGRGVFFRDLSGGNILIRKQADGSLAFSLIDINRAHFFNKSTVLSKRIADLTRICNKLHWEGREQLVGRYLTALGRPFSLRFKLPFYLYDSKVWLKRYLGRKAITRLFRKKRPAH